MKSFELSSLKLENGKRKFKAILFEVFPDSTVDEVMGVGTKFNINGISFIESYVKAKLDTIVGSFLRTEFIDDERREIAGHGITDIIDNNPIFEDATSIGVFTDAYLKTEIIDGEEHIYCIGEGEIDAQCYNNFTNRLMEDLENGIFPSGSIEICREDDEDSIIYLYGYKDKGRIPVKFRFSGYAIIGVPPSDPAAKLIELNQKKEDCIEMNENEIKMVVEAVIAELNSRNNELEECKSNYEAQISELNEQLTNVTAELNSKSEECEQHKTALELCQANLTESEQKVTALGDELKKAQEKEKIAELNNAIKDFTDEERDFAKAEIESFKNDPMACEINSIVDKIYANIGRNAKEKVAEQNQRDNDIDIFGEVGMSDNNEDDNIF